MQENAKLILDSFLTYSGRNPIWFIYAAAFLYLLFTGGKTLRRIFVYPVLFLALTVFNPPVTGLILRVVGQETQFHRLFWTIPFAVTIGYAAVLFLCRIKKRVLKITVALVLTLLIAVVGIPVFFGGEDVPEFMPPENAAFTTDDIRQLSNIYHSEGIQTPKVLYDQALTLAYRCYDPDVTSFISRYFLRRYLILPLDEFLNEMPKNATARIMRVYYYGDHNVSPKVFRDALVAREIDYITVKNTSSMIEYLQGGPLTQVGTTDHYTVYAVNR